MLLFTGIYVSWANLKVKYAQNLENIHLIGYVPHGANLLECLQPFYKELALLSNGVEMVVCVPSENGEPKWEKKKVYGNLAVIISDTPQASQLCSHSGHSSTMICRKCKKNKRSAKLKSNLASFDIDITSVWYKRRAAETREMLRFYQSDNSMNNRDRQILGLRVSDTRHAIEKNLPYPFFFISDEFDFDVNMQTPGDVDHIFFYGLSRMVISSIIRVLGTENNREILRRRLQHFVYPRGWSKIKFDILTGAAHSASTSMALYNRLLTIMLHIVRGLVDEEIYNILTSLFRLRCKVYHKQLPKSDWEILRKEAVSFLIRCESCKVVNWKKNIKTKAKSTKSTSSSSQVTNSSVITDSDESKEFSFSRSNTHSLEELFTTDIPIYGNAAFIRTQSFESKHQIAKLFLRNTNNRDVHKTIHTYYNYHSAMQYLLHGGLLGSAGSDNTRQASVDLLNLKDSKSPDLPHGLIRQFTNYPYAPSHGPKKAEWVPASFDRNKHRKIVARKLEDFKSPELEGIRGLLFNHGIASNTDVIVVRTFNKLFNYRRLLSIQVDDHVRYKTSLLSSDCRYALIKTLYWIKIETKCYMFWRGTGFSTQEKDPFSQAELPTVEISRSLDIFYPVECLDRQVMMVHFCTYNDTASSTRDNGSKKGGATNRMYGPQYCGEQRPNCPLHEFNGCPAWSFHDRNPSSPYSFLTSENYKFPECIQAHKAGNYPYSCSPTNRLWIVHDENHGFNPEFKSSAESYHVKDISSASVSLPDVMP
jgi:hypothetical protein